MLGKCKCDPIILLIDDDLLCFFDIGSNPSVLGWDKMELNIHLHWGRGLWFSSHT